ncbi:hypothetical protein [Streptacidiphilus sp. EB129]|uniref:hypothetical protein n=1 Tax=Streptacidiphilus sp. EB129 TaxID=3156262 RepID=UPI0035192455
MTGLPPDNERCNGIYGEKYRQRPELRGERCEQRKLPGTDFCNQHFIPDHRRCTARLSKNHPTSPGQRCRCWALKGQHVCGFHGGHAPQNKAAAKRRIIEERARTLVATYGRKIETTAVEALLDEVQWTAGHVAWLRDRVQEIEAQATDDDTENPLVWGRTRRKTGGEDRGETHEAGANVWLKLYQTERAHLVRVCSEAIRAGIEERRVKLAESQGEQVAQAIRGILSDLHLTAEQLALVPDIVPKHLRALIS